MTKVSGKMANRVPIAALLLLLSPAIFSTLYLYATRFAQWSAVADVIALTGTVTLGLLGVLLLPVRPLPKTLISLVYIPVAGFLTVAWSISVACYVFAECP